MEHAKLSPSAASRWIACPASIRMEEELPPSVVRRESGFAREGTLAHALAEIEASRHFGLIATRAGYERKLEQWGRLFHAENYEPHVLGEMEEHVRGYVDLLSERLTRRPMSQIQLEKQMPTGIPNCWGTSDAIIFSPTHIEVVDLKYGTGVPVSAVENPQLRLYGLAALRMYGGVLGHVDTVYTTIYQPRIGNISTDEISRRDLLRWKKEVALPAAMKTQDPKAPFGPSESACRFCPAAGVCRARIRAAVGEDFGLPYVEEEPEPVEPEALTPEEISRVLGRAPIIRHWLDAIEAYALTATTTGHEIPGWKTVMSGGRRAIVDQTAAIQTLIDHGFKAEDVAEFKVKALGTLERLVGKKELPEILGPLLGKTDGRESLVREDDPRPSVAGPKEDFAEANDEGE